MSPGWRTLPVPSSLIRSPAPERAAVRILHVASGREWRGGQRQTWLLTQGLAARGIAQRLVTRKGSELAQRAAASGVEVVAARWSAGLDPRALASVVRGARSADILHAHDSHAVSLAAAAAALTNRPFVATRRMTRQLRSSGPWRRARRVIAISSAVRDALIESGVNPGAISLIHPAIDVGLTRKALPIEWNTVAPIPPGVVVVLALAALTREKGIDLLLDAMGDSRVAAEPIHCVIAGKGPESAVLALRARALEPPGRVHFIGHVADPLPLLAAAGGLVVPSREEAFGSTILDALALGIPVIAARVGGIPEALAYGGGVTFRAGDPGALATELVSLVADPARRARMAASGRDAAPNFDLAGMVDRTLAVYRSVTEDVERQ